MKYRFAISLLLPLSLFACAQAGHSFDMSRVNELQPGISSEDDAKALLGEPIRSATDPHTSHHELIWAYGYATPVSAGVKSVAIVFDENGTMMKVVDTTAI